MASCKNCNLAIKTNSPNIQCDVCHGYMHSSCLDLSVEVNAMVTRAKSRCLKVVCNVCNQNISQFQDLKSLILSLKADFSSAMESLKNEFTEKLTALKMDMDTQLQSQKPEFSFEEVVEEVGERQRRRCNVVVFGVPEQLSELSADERITADNVEVSSILKSIQPSLEVSNLKPRRLGHYNSRGATPRPIKLVLDSEAAVHSVTRESRKLRNITKYKNVYVSFDKTPRQLQIYKDLKAELQARVAGGESNLEIKYVRGIPKIVRLN